MAFTGEISKWDVSSVEGMCSMFLRATAFNIDISKWDVSRVTNMELMFMGAESFEQKLCGDAWVRSNAADILMFAGSHGSILSTVCMPSFTPDDTQVTTDYVTRRPLTGRELVVRTPISTLVSTPAFSKCPKCGTFAKSGRVSCCAPGGAWYKKCGSAANKNVDRKWSEGAAACKPVASTTISP